MFIRGVAAAVWGSQQLSWIALTGSLWAAIETSPGWAATGLPPERGLERITSGAHDEMEPQWSPDGTRLSYGAGTQGDQNVFVFDLRSGEEIQATKGLGFVHATTWGPQGDRIAYVTTQDTDDGIQSHIYIVHLETHDVEQVTFEPCIDGSPSWSPDGKTMAFPSRRSGVFNLWVQPLDGSRAPMMVTEHAETDHGPEWSADGKSIAFHSDHGETASIWVLDLESDTLTRITDDGGNDQYPDWSPDGRFLVFDSDRSGNHDIWIQRIGDDAPLRVTRDDASDFRPSWSPDGKRIAFSSDRAGTVDVWVVDAPDLSSVEAR